MSDMQLFWLGVNIALSGIAMCVNIWYSARFRGAVRFMFVVIGSTAAGYCASFVWLWSHPEKVSEWSNTLRPFSALTWIAPWIASPLVLSRYTRQKAEGVIEHAETEVHRILTGGCNE